MGLLDFAMKRREEFGKRCELCRKNRESHMYPFPVDSKYRRLCRECWDKVHKSNASLEPLARKDGR